MSKRKIFSGDIVRVKASFLNEPVNVLAFVYEEYNLFENERGVSLITENGVNLGGFNPDEQEQYLEFVKESIPYTFTNVIQLDRDFEKMIKPSFQR